MAQLNVSLKYKKTVLSLLLAALFSATPVFAEDSNVIKIDPQEELAEEVGANEEGNIQYREGAEPKYQTTAPTNREQIKFEDINPENKKTFSVQAEALAGSSSNVARFEGAPSGSYTDFSPRLVWTPNLGEKLDLALSADAFLRTFHDNEVDELFRTSSVSGSGEMTYFFGNSFFAGIDGQITRFEGRDLDFRSATGSGRDVIFTNNQGNALFGKDIQNGYLVFNVGREWERAETIAFDEAGNEFFTDYNQTHGGMRIQKQFTERFNVEAGYQLKYREFLSQRARLENGQAQAGADFFGADLAEEVEHSITTVTELRPVVLELSYDYIGDMVSGAENRYSFGAVLAVPFNPFSFLFVRPEAGVQNTFYENFLGEIYRRGIAIADGVNPDSIQLSSNDKRNDVMSFYGIEMVIDTGLIKPVINARHTELTSNFSIIQFEEDMVSGGIRLQF